MRFGIGLDQGDAFGIAASEAEVIERRATDREEAAGGAVLGRHVGDGRLIGERQSIEAGTEKLDKLADHALLAQHLRDGEHQIGGGRPFGQLAREPEPYDFRDQHRNRLSQHGRFGLDAADTPSQDGEAVDHRRVTVGADQRIGISDDGAVGARCPHHLRQVFKVDLVADACARRDDAEVVERSLSPAQERVTLFVALVLKVHIIVERLSRARDVNHDRVIDDEIDRHQRIDLRRIGASRLHRIAHRREIDDRRHTGEVLHQDPRRTERDLAIGGASLKPAGDRPDIVGRHRSPVLPAQEIFEEDLEGERQPRDAAQPRRFRGCKAVVFVRLIPNLQRAARTKGVERSFGHLLAPASASSARYLDHTFVSVHGRHQGGAASPRRPPMERDLSTPDAGGPTV